MTWTPVVFCLAMLCTSLWGSAFPSVKIGYRLFQVSAEDTASQILFAGYRFFLAGILVVLIGSVTSRKILLPSKSNLLPILLLSFFQTSIQYYFFYIGLAHASGVKSSIITAGSTFFTLIFAALFFHYEKLTLKKILGCLIGFSGVVLITTAGASLTGGLTIRGEGFVLLSTVSYAISSCLVKGYSKKHSPVLLCGYQFILGGFMLIVGGILMGGHLTVTTPLCFLLLFYMACISAVAYSVWSILLKHNPVSRICVFSFTNPVIGVILSALLLGEQNQAFSIYGLLALILVSIGILVVYVEKKPIKNAAT
ncbi:MAG: DMT family transporter [Lachnospiraceae bacterium]|nr:DMT family transporter [Lachnospiraceae bacterium]